MQSASDLLVPYRLRTVRIGIAITWLTLGALLALPFLPGHSRIVLPWYAVVLAGGAIGAIVVMALPWRRLFDAGLGVRFMYAWSCADIVLVSIGVASSGGGHSDVFLVYTLTTVFFCASYPMKGQLGLLLFTFASYATAIGFTGWHVTPEAMFIRVSGLALLTMLASFLARELTRQMEAHSEARERSERWASLLAGVAAAVRSMTLVPDRILEVAMDTAIAFGFESAAICRLSEDEHHYEILLKHGMPEEYGSTPYRSDQGVTGLVRRTGATAVIDDYAAWTGGIRIAREEGLKAVVGAPIRNVDGIGHVLIAGTRRRRAIPKLEVEALELLAAQAALSLERAEQYEEQQRTVERLEELDRMKSDFLATVSHELRTPLTVIEGSGLTLQRNWDQLDDQTRRDLLAGLTGNASALRGIISTLLELSRIERQPEVSFLAFGLSELVRGIAERTQSLFAERTLVVDVTPGIDAVGDPGLVDRVVENLLSNAAKHTPPGTLVTLSVSTEDGRATVVVVDNGPGIPPHELEHVGERFFRGGNLNERSRGLGLGLALAKEMLELQGSELEIQSVQGLGSRFSFSLPLRGDASSPRAERTRRDTPATADTTRSSVRE
jgi:signal transduction histidine kinase